MSLSWIEWYCNKPGNKIFALVDEEFIKDDFNMVGLRKLVDEYDYALDFILDYKIPKRVWKYKKEKILKSAELLYGLTHARYILTKPGLAQMLEKFYSETFDKCPRVYCNGQAVLPIGENDAPGHTTLKIYCPSCKDIYHPRNNTVSIDGAYFGKTFPHLLLHTYPKLQPTTNSSSKKYTPTIYGFKIHPSSDIIMKDRSSF